MTLVAAVDWSHRGGASILFDVGVPVVPVPVPPVVPDPPDPTPRAEPRRYTLVAHDGLTFAPIVAFPTVDVAEYTAGQLGTDAMRHRVTVASTDPAWTLLCAHRGVPAGAIHQVVEGIDWRLYEDGVLVASGISDGPVTSGATVDLRISGGGGILRDRFLGDGGIKDLLDGRGKWGRASLSGWVIDGLEWRWSTEDPFSGDRSLELRGLGYLYSPWGAAVATQGQGQQIIHSRAVVRLPDDGYIVTRTDTRFTDGTPVETPDAIAESWRGSGDADQDGWQEVVSRGRVPAGDGRRVQARTVIAVGSSTGWVEIGRVVQGQADMVGALARNPADLETLLRVVVGAAQRPESGGPLGIVPVIHSRVGVKDGIQWRFDQNPTVGDALSSVLDRSDAPEAWFTPDRVFHIARRAGRDRTDLVLNQDTVIDASIEVDSGTRFDEVRAQTGFGSGRYRAVIPASGSGGPAGAPKRRAIIQAPNELSFRSAEKWVAGAAEQASRQAVSVRAVVPDWYGRAFAPGDGVRVALDVDGWTIRAAMRVGQITVQPSAGTVVLELGFDKKVNLP